MVFLVVTHTCIYGCIVCTLAVVSQPFVYSPLESLKAYDVIETCGLHQLVP